MTAWGVRTARSFPETGNAVMDLLASWYPALATDPLDPTRFHVGRDWPSTTSDEPGGWTDILQALPLVRVRSIGGHDNKITDRPLIDIDVLHFTPDEASDLGRDIQRRLLGYPHRVGAVVIDEVDTAMRPHDVPWDDDRVARCYASYTFGNRR